MRSDQNGCPNRLGVFGYPHIWRESRWRSDSSRDRRIANSPSSSSNNISLLSCLVTVPVKSWSGSTSAQRASSVIRSLVSMRLSRINFFSSSIALRRSGVACCGAGVLISMVPKGTLRIVTMMKAALTLSSSRQGVNDSQCLQWQSCRAKQTRSVSVIRCRNNHLTASI